MAQRLILMIAVLLFCTLNGDRADAQRKDSEDLIKNKKPATFEEQTWNEVDAKEKVKRPRR